MTWQPDSPMPDSGAHPVVHQLHGVLHREHERRRRRREEAAQVPHPAAQAAENSDVEGGEHGS
ncbi:MAG TPA: hypothetical protein VFH45_08960 [Acidimicrobiales bacterium]|nr:hypothetical protein [Acidimicrobiales bacterium]